MRWSIVTFLLGITFLVGCNTVERRIQRNLQTFNSFPPEVQENIRKGKIEPGYTKDMVTIALGRPDRIYTRKTSSEKTEIWAYQERVSGSSAGVGFVIIPHHYHHHGAFFLAQDFSFSGHDDIVERLRVEWENGKVKTIEEIKDD